jgi:ribosomal protein L1
LCMGVAVGNVGMTEDQLISNIMRMIPQIICKVSLKLTGTV